MPHGPKWRVVPPAQTRPPDPPIDEARTDRPTHTQQVGRTHFTALGQPQRAHAHVPQRSRPCSALGGTHLLGVRLGVQILQRLVTHFFLGQVLSDDDPARTTQIQCDHTTATRVGARSPVSPTTPEGPSWAPITHWAALGERARGGGQPQIRGPLPPPLRAPPHRADPHPSTRRRSAQPPDEEELGHAQRPRNAPQTPGSTKPGNTNAGPARLRVHGADLCHAAPQISLPTWLSAVCRLLGSVSPIGPLWVVDWPLARVAATRCCSISPPASVADSAAFATSADTSSWIIPHQLVCTPPSARQLRPPTLSGAVPLPKSWQHYCSTEPVGGEEGRMGHSILHRLPVPVHRPLARCPHHRRHSIWSCCICLRSAAWPFVGSCQRSERAFAVLIFATALGSAIFNSNITVEAQTVLPLLPFGGRRMKRWPPNARPLRVDEERDRGEGKPSAGDVRTAKRCRCGPRLPGRGAMTRNDMNY